jgi:hypothetical protein
MQYEHTASDELKELAERQAVEIAEKEENWEQERDLLKEEISSLRERITSKAGIYPYLILFTENNVNK